MSESRSLEGKTMLISGGSRGIGLAIALRAARDGANVALIAKTDQPHPKLEGTIHTAAEQIEEAGGQALPIVGDIRDESRVAEAVAETVERFGGIDVCVNNASAINLVGTEQLDMKRYDLMQDINTRGTFVVSKLCVPHLKQSENPHVLTLSPPLSLEPRWAKDHVAYTIAKYGMSLCTLGMAEEFRDDGIAFNSLWPRTLVATAAVQNLLGGDAAMARSRTPEIMSDSAHAILTRPSRECTGNFFLAEDVLVEEGVDRLRGLRGRARRRAGRRPLRRRDQPARHRLSVRDAARGPPVLLPPREGRAGDDRLERPPRRGADRRAGPPLPRRGRRRRRRAGAARDGAGHGQLQARQRALSPGRHHPVRVGSDAARRGRKPRSIDAGSERRNEPRRERSSAS